MSRIHPPSYIENSRKLELELTLFKIDDSYANGFSMILPQEIDREDIEAVLDALKSTEETIRKILDRL